MAIDVKMILSAQDGASSVLKGLENSFKGLSSTVESAMAPMLSSLGSFQNIIGVVAGGAGLKSLISAYSSWSGEVINLGRNLGMTTEQASVFNTALRLSGVDSDVAVSAGMRLARTIDTNEEKFSKLGVSVRDSSGNLRSTPAIMADVMAALSSMGSGTERNVMANEIFGRSWQDVQQLMKLTPGVMDKAAESASALGLIIDKDGAEAAKRYKLAMNELGLAGESLKISLGATVMPIMAEIAKGMSGVAEHMDLVKASIVAVGTAEVLANLGRLTIALKAVSAAATGTTGLVGLAALAGLAVGNAIDQTFDLSGKQQYEKELQRDKESQAAYDAVMARRNAKTSGPDLSRSVGMTDAERQKALAEQQAYNNAVIKLEDTKNANILSRYQGMSGAYLALEKSRYDAGTASAYDYYTYKLQLLTWETQAQETNLDLRLVGLRSEMAAETDRTKQLGIETEIERVKGDKEKLLMDQSKKRTDIVRELNDAEKKESDTKEKQIEQDAKAIEQHAKEIEQMDKSVNQLWPKYAEQMAKELGMDDESVKLNKQLADGTEAQIKLTVMLQAARKLADDPAIASLNKMISLQDTLNQRLRDDIALQERKAVLTGGIVGFSDSAITTSNPSSAIYANGYANSQAQNGYVTNAQLTSGKSSSPQASSGSTISYTGSSSPFVSVNSPYFGSTPASTGSLPATSSAGYTAGGNSFGADGSWLGPAYALGTPYVPQTELALVHQGERIIPAAQNKAVSAQNASLDGWIEWMGRSGEKMSTNVHDYNDPMKTQTLDGLWYQDASGAWKTGNLNVKDYTYYALQYKKNLQYSSALTPSQRSYFTSPDYKPSSSDGKPLATYAAPQYAAQNAAPAFVPSITPVAPATSPLAQSSVTSGTAKIQAGLQGNGVTINVGGLTVNVGTTTDPKTLARQLYGELQQLATRYRA